MPVHRPTSTNRAALSWMLAKREDELSQMTYEVAALRHAIELLDKEEAAFDAP